MFWKRACSSASASHGRSIFIAKSLRSRTAKGKSIAFELLIIAGYLCGLVGKLILGNLSYVVFFYIADILMVAADLVLTLRNCRLDRERDKV